MPFVEAKILHDSSSIGRIGLHDVQLNPVTRIVKES